MILPKFPVPVVEMENALNNRDIRYLGDKRPTLLDQNVATCPACTEGRVGVKLTTGTYRGQKRVRLAYLQCSAWPQDPRHGYGPRSPFTDTGYKFAGHPTLSATAAPLPARTPPTTTAGGYKILLVQGGRTIEIDPVAATVTLRP